MLCEVCDKAGDCRNCVAARTDSTFREMGEDAVIKEALKIKQVSGSGQSAKYIVELEYPTYEPLHSVYNDQNSNLTAGCGAIRSLFKAQTSHPS